MGYHHPVGSWQGTLYLHNGKCFQMPSCPSYNCFMNSISLPTGNIGSWAKLVTVVSSDGYFLWDFFEDKCLCAQLKKFSEKPFLFPLSSCHPIRQLHSKRFCIKLSDWIIGIEEGTLISFRWIFSAEHSVNLCYTLFYSILCSDSTLLTPLLRVLLQSTLLVR